MNSRCGRSGDWLKSASRRWVTVAASLWLLAATSSPATAAVKLSWLDDVVQEVIAEAKTGGKAVVREAAGDPARLAARRGGRLFLQHEADEGLEQLIKRSDDLARSARRVEQPSEVLLQARFSRVLQNDPQALRSFSALAPAEKRLVVELSEAAQVLTKRYPKQAETMVKQLGPEGLSAVRVFGDDIAEVLAKEGAEGLSVLRKTGRGGWSFFTQQVLPHKKKLAAAGILAAFLANPDDFVDYAGRATEYAVKEFARAGIQLATAVGGGAARGLESTISRSLAAYGLDVPILRYLGMGLAGLVVAVSSMVLLGLPITWMTKPLRPIIRIVRGRRSLSRISGSSGL